jgi:hypothetical protein
MVLIKIIDITQPLVNRSGVRMWTVVIMNWRTVIILRVVIVIQVRKVWFLRHVICRRMMWSFFSWVRTSSGMQMDFLLRISPWQISVWWLNRLDHFLWIRIGHFTPGRPTCCCSRFVRTWRISNTIMTRRSVICDVSWVGRQTFWVFLILTLNSHVI